MPPRENTRSLPRRARAAALGAVLLLSLAACGGSSQGGASTAAGPVNGSVEDSAAGGASAGYAAASAAAAAPNDASAQQAAGNFSDAKVPSAANLRADQIARPRRIRTADMTVTVKDLDTASASIRAAVEGAGGYISSETTAVSQPVDSKQPDGSVTSVQTGSSVVVARIPEPDLDSTLAKVGTIGKVVNRNQTDQDVTGEIADAASRIDTQRASVARTRQLLAQAKSVQDIVFIEGQLTTREADLEALQARLKSLSDRADFSTLTVTMQLPDVVPVETPKETNSFLSGLKSGWEALVSSTNVVLTILGAVLPVGFVLLVVGYPAAVLLRRRTQRQQAERDARWAATQGPVLQQQVPVMAGAPAPDAADAPAPDGTPDGTPDATS